MSTDSQPAPEGTATETAPDELNATLQAAADAFASWSGSTPRQRAGVLRQVADDLAAASSELVKLAAEETQLPLPRLEGEVTRTVEQLRFFADVAQTGAEDDVVIDRAYAEHPIAPRPELRRHTVPLGPALVFGAGNFPFAFSVAGTDTAAALAAGCPVVVKGHPGHPQTAAATARIVRRRLVRLGVPEGVFAVITGVDAGVQALRDSRIRVAAFTGSTAGGRALFDVANSRPDPIPFFGELGSLNPVVVTQEAEAERPQEIVDGFVGALTGSAGQLCTKPGLLFLPSGSSLVDRVRQAIAEQPQYGMLDERIAAAYQGRVDEARSLDSGSATPGSAGAGRQGQPHVVHVADAQQLLTRPDADLLLEETFGPFGVLVEYDEPGQIEAVLEQLGGTLTWTVQSSHTASQSERTLIRRLLDQASRLAGRIVFNEWPTGLSITSAQHHGGPYPASTSVFASSVGGAALRRFVRPVVYQNAPDWALPAAVQDKNPWQLPQTVHDAM